MTGSWCLDRPAKCPKTPLGRTLDLYTPLYDGIFNPLGTYLFLSEKQLSATTVDATPIRYDISVVQAYCSLGALRVTRTNIPLRPIDLVDLQTRYPQIVEDVYDVQCHRGSFPKEPAVVTKWRVLGLAETDSTERGLLFLPWHSSFQD